MKKILFTSLLLLSAAVWAQLPSWGMTEQQYKMPNRSAKLADIGKEAVKHKWQLKVTAPQAWHSSIRAGLSKDGEKNVMMTFKDSLHQSITISAAKAKHMGQTVKSSGDTQVVHKQVVIDDKPEIDTSVERPEFGDEFMNAKTSMAKVELDMAIPKATQNMTKPKAKPVARPKPKAKVAAKPAPKPVAKPAPKPVAKPVAKPAPKAVAQVDDVVQKAQTYLRKRYAKNKKTNGTLPYDRVTQDDTLYIKDDVVLVARVNNGRTFFYWMKESYDPASQAIEHKSSEKYIKTEATAPAANSQTVEVQSKTAKVDRTELVFTAETDNRSDQDDLRRDYIRNKMVKHTYGADKIKSGDLIYTQNNTALVVRRLSRTNEIYFWLKGEVNVTENVTMMKTNEFKIK